MRARPIPFSLTLHELFSCPLETKLDYLACRSPSERLRHGAEMMKEMLKGITEQNERMNFLKPFPVKNNPLLG